MLRDCWQRQHHASGRGNVCDRVQHKLCQPERPVAQLWFRNRTALHLCQRPILRTFTLQRSRELVLNYMKHPRQLHPHARRYSTPRAAHSCSSATASSIEESRGGHCSRMTERSSSGICFKTEGTSSIPHPA